MLSTAPETPENIQWPATPEPSEIFNTFLSRPQDLWSIWRCSGPPAHVSESIVAQPVGTSSLDFMTEHRMQDPACIPTLEPSMVPGVSTPFMVPPPQLASNDLDVTHDTDMSVAG